MFKEKLFVGGEFISNNVLKLILHGQRKKYDLTPPSSQ